MEFMFFLLFLLSIVIYFIPTIIAFKAEKKQATAIFVMNLFLGWSVLGWIIALIWAVSKD